MWRVLTCDGIPMTTVTQYLQRYWYRVRIFFIFFTDAFVFIWLSDTHSVPFGGWLLYNFYSRCLYSSQISVQLKCILTLL